MLVVHCLKARVRVAIGSWPEPLRSHIDRQVISPEGTCLPFDRCRWHRGTGNDRDVLCIAQFIQTTQASVVEPLAPQVLLECLAYSKVTYSGIKPDTLVNTD